MRTKEIKDPYNIRRLSALFENMGYQFKFTPQTPTTMDLAKVHAQSGGETPAIFLTDHQTNGIGREGRVWLDKVGASILATGLVRSYENLTPIFTDLTALHACRALMGATGIECMRIKYPNDLVVGDAKLGGMLTSNLYDDEMRYLGTSIGIGINVHYKKEDLAGYPTDYGATSLDLQSGRSNYRQGLLIAVFDGMQYLSVDAEIFFENLMFRQDQNDLWRVYSSVLGRRVQVLSGEEVLVAGTVKDTQIGKGVLVENPRGRRWHNQFGTTMKVRLLD